MVRATTRFFILPLNYHLQNDQCFHSSLRPNSLLVSSTSNNFFSSELHHFFLLASWKNFSVLFSQIVPETSEFGLHGIELHLPCSYIIIFLSACFYKLSFTLTSIWLLNISIMKTIWLVKFFKMLSSRNTFRTRTYF